MHFGFNLPNNQGVSQLSDLIDLARHAEALGYDSVWVSEHLFHTSYVRERIGDAPYHEPLTLLTAIAMATQRIALGTSVLVLPWHHPVRLAKTTASLDHLSNGRLILGVGVGMAVDEYANLGVDFHARGAIADETLSAMQALWTTQPPRYEGKYFRFADLNFAPKCLQKPHVPLWVGGNSTAALRRAAQQGQGWQPLSLSANEISKGRLVLQQLGVGSQFPIAPRLMLSIAAEPWERPVEQRKTAKGTISELRALVHAYAESGATHLIMDANNKDIVGTKMLMTQFKQQVVEG